MGFRLQPLTFNFQPFIFLPFHFFTFLLFHLYKKATSAKDDSENGFLKTIGKHGDQTVSNLRPVPALCSN